MSPSRNIFVGLALAGLLAPAFARAQDRDVVSKEISVGRSEAALRLEFGDGETVEIAFRDGGVFIGGDESGTYGTGDGLDLAWRALLGDAVAVDDGPLAQVLRDWAPPGTLAGEQLALAQRIDQTLEAELAVQSTSASDPPDPALPGGNRVDGALLRALIQRPDRLDRLAEALEGLGSEVRVHVDEDAEVAEGETVEGALVVVEGDARIDGTVDGDVVVVDGELELGPEGRVLGDVSLVDAQFDGDEARVSGRVVNLMDVERDLEAEIRARIREELRDEIENEVLDERTSSFAPVRGVVRGVVGVFESLAVILVLGLIGLAVVAFAGENLEAVAETARRAPGRSATVGLAGTFLLVPAWILGAVALAVSIVGIPVMIAWLPLFPLAAVAAAVLGYLAVAHNVGAWLADSDYRYTGWIRKTSPVHTVFGGILGLMAAFVLANVLSIVPFFGFFRGLFVALGVVLMVIAALVGFGAVLLTRAGRRPIRYPMDYDAAWAEAVGAVDIEEAEAGPGGGSHA